MGLMVSAGILAEEYEPVPILSAAQILTPELLQSEDHKVADNVVNDGYMNLYRIESEYGEFSAHGSTMLALRVQEVHALAELAGVSKTDVFLESAGAAAAAPIKAVEQLVEKPGETIKGIPGGVKRMFKGLKRDVEEVSEKSKEAAAARKADDGDEDPETSGGKSDELTSAASTYAKKYFGISGAERRWAEKLSVDPYSSNEVLHKKIKQVANVDAIASFGTRLVMPRIPGVSTMGTVTKMVWSVDPRELREQNLARLESTGVGPELIANFLDQPWYSPTLQTLLVTDLLKMESVGGLSLALDLALAAESEEEALFLVQTVHMLSELHHAQGITSLAAGASLPGALTADNRLIYPLPVDHVAWTAEVAADSQSALPDLGQSYNPKSRELWLRGTASPRCVEELDGLGWSVRTEVKIAQ